MSRHKIEKGLIIPSGEMSPTQEQALSQTADALKVINLLLDETVMQTGVPSGNVDLAQRNTSEAMVYLAIEASHDDEKKTHEILNHYGLDGLFPKGE